MTSIGIVLGSTREGRRGDQVAAWVHEVGARRTDATFEVVDLRDHPLPHLGEPAAPEDAARHAEQRSRWSATIAGFDGFVLVTPEYNHSTSGVLKNALDHLQAEWHDKAVGIVSYGGVGGARAAEHLRLIAGELQMADVRQQVPLSLMTEFGADFATLTPGEYNQQALSTLLDQVVAWSTALAPLRGKASAAA
ncbi:NAD(P)H-dependent oxidoreductase [Arthrobacter sp. NEB 688]|uniref:NADPH-dependent FMN reductase n=1 Tax=Arthrobacter sp. NEB 688 TaxID=904039 RepID=UPI00156327DB|nr:NAD(P)H-dependent oxidoreductase [Arthrobacter sp. NEB 688]QKE82900.1 NAD(P)H-dependent oxidoreductase [Arthrobacter sp. NEB 688]